VLAALSDAALSVVTALSQCRLHLSDIRDGKLLAGGLLFQLLSNYIKVTYCTTYSPQL
jgi:hypothetical protein